MSNYRETKRELAGYIRASVPLVVIRSFERQRVERLARELAREHRFNIHFYTDAHQLQWLEGNEETPINVDSDPLPFISEKFLKCKHLTIVLGDTRRLDSDSLYARELLSVVQLAQETRNTVVVVTGEEVWSRFSHFGLFLQLSLPNFDERLSIVEQFIHNYQPSVEWDADDARQASVVLRGLSEVQIVNVLRSSLAETDTLKNYNIPQLGYKKEMLFAPVSSVSFVDYDEELDAAGLKNFQDWLKVKRDAFFASNSKLEHYNLQTPKGVLLVGVPGCGKSFSAKIVSSTWGLPLFRFDICSIYNKYVGETERSMHEALEYIDNIAPCVLWVDEIEKVLSATSGESDVGRRVLGQFLFWLQESRARIFLVATANDVSSLPPELFRKGRFSEIFFVDLPNENERTEAIRLFTDMSFHVEYEYDELRALADVTEGFSYSDIEQAIKDYAELVAFHGKRVPTFSELRESFTHVIPISDADDRIKTIRRWGAVHARPASAEPEELE